MEERIKCLLRKFLSNTCSKEEFDEVFFYIKAADADPSIQNILEQVFNHELEQLPANAFVDEQGNLSGIAEQEEVLMPVVRKRKGRLLLLAGSLTIIIMAGFTWALNVGKQKTGGDSPAGMSYLTRSTDRSEYQYLVLPDSTQVWLNAASSLEFPKEFGKNKREVILKGEAFFDVKHADKIPFVIYSGEVTTEVLGTAFNIKAYPDLEKITVSVKRGKVKVNYAKNKTALLGVGQQVIIEKKGNIAKEKKVKEAETAAWQEGKLIYDDYTVEDIIKDIERVYNVEVEVESLSVKNVRVSTSFERKLGIEKALEIISKLTDSELTQKNRIYYIK